MSRLREEIRRADALLMKLREGKITYAAWVAAGRPGISEAGRAKFRALDAARGAERRFRASRRSEVVQIGRVGDAPLEVEFLHRRPVRSARRGRGGSV